MSNELPDSVQKKTDLMLQLADDKKILQGLEDEILRLLSESSGNILDDDPHISFSRFLKTLILNDLGCFLQTPCIKQGVSVKKKQGG